MRPFSPPSRSASSRGRSPTPTSTPPPRPCPPPKRLASPAKPTYLAMAVGICILGLLRPWMAGPRRWPFFAAGVIATVGLVFGVIALAGLFTLFRHQAFGLLLQARPRPIGFYLYQD